MQDTAIQLCHIVYGYLSVCTHEYYTIDTSQCSFSIPEEDRHHKKIFWSAHEIFLLPKPQSESTMIILSVHQIHCYFPENSPLLDGKILYWFLAPP